MKKFNLNELIWFLILISFSYFIYHLFNSGKINLYMHPKMFKFVFFSLVVFILLAILQVKNIFTISSSKKLNLGYFIFIIPLLLAFILNPDNLSTQIVAKKGVNLTSDVNFNQITNKDDDSNQNNLDDYEDNASLPLNIAEDNATPKPTPSSDDNTTDKKDFLSIIMEAYDQLDVMTGKEIELTGFIYKEEEFDKDYFVISRLLMVCCAADTQVVGIMCELKDNDLENNQWIKIIGTIGSTSQYNVYTKEDEIIPLIKISEVKLTTEPLNQYVYP